MINLSKLTVTTLLGVTVLAMSGCQSDSNAIEGSASEVETETIEQPVLVEADMTTAGTEVDLSDAEIAALELFKFQEGTWDSVWTMYDSTGSNTSVMEGTQTFAYLVDQHSQLMTTVIPDMNHISYNIRGYDPLEGEIVALMMGRKGDYWLMRQDPVTGVTVSDPHKNFDGTTIIRKFSRSAISDDAYELNLEVSEDGGANWYTRFKQKLTRREEN